MRPFLKNVELHSTLVQRTEPKALPKNKSLIKKLIGNKNEMCV